MNSLREEVLKLSQMAEYALSESVRILKKRLFSEGAKLIARDEEINLQCYRIEEHCLDIIATQQPVAGDLRFLFATMQIAMELERIADYAKGIAVINGKIAAGTHVRPLAVIQRMQIKANEMLKMSMDSFLERDVMKAEKLPSMDVEIDLLYEQVFRELVSLELQNEERMVDAMLLTFVAHNLERAGDRVINVCERVVYLCTGKVVDLS